MRSTEEFATVLKDCETWPADQQARWIDRMAPEVGAPTWKPVTQYTVARVYSRYLLANAKRGQNSLTPDGVRSWIRELEANGCCARTIAGYLWALDKVASVVVKDRPEWLRRTCVRVDKIASRTPKRKRAFIVPAEAILQFGFETIIRARCLGPKGWRATQMFRDGLFLVFSIHGPERLRALTSVNIDDLNLEQFLLRYPANLIKGEVVSVRAMPAIVADLVREWISIWRSRHAPLEDHGHLWIAQGGRPAGAAALVAAMRKLTASGPWGYSITPHRLRDAAATFLVDEGPDVARLASVVLCHQSERTTREYTETANRIRATRSGRQIISEVRDKIGKQARR